MPTARDVPPERQIRLAAIALGGVVAVALALAHSPASALALALGAALSVFNFAWLDAGVRSLLAAVAGAPLTRPILLGALRFFARFLLLLVCLCAIFISHLVPMVWVVAGLFAVPAAAILVGIWLLLVASRTRTVP